jgi:hypothetical protein
MAQATAPILDSTIASVFVVQRRVRCQGKPGRPMLRASISHFDPFRKWKTICSLANFCRAVRAKQWLLGRGLSSAP